MEADQYFSDVFKMKRKINVDYLYLDLSMCERCQGTEQVLNQALDLLKPILTVMDLEIVLNKINVINEALAIEHEFISSPTIRVDGRDIVMEVREDSCSSCSDLSGEAVDCRVWVYKDKEYSEPPLALVLERMIEVIFCKGETLDETLYVLPENLAVYYEGYRKVKK